MTFNWYDSNRDMNCGGYGTIENFLDTNVDECINALKNFVGNNLDFEIGKEQVISWRDCYKFLRNKFIKLIELDLNYKNLYIAFEYYLPMEGGRRPDVVLFADKRLIIFEFKRKNSYKYADIEQAIGYKRDIQSYHRKTNEKNLEVISYLILTKGCQNYEPKDGIEILNKSNFIGNIDQLNLQVVNKQYVVDWLNSSYEPLPSIVKATLNLFKEGNLPQIKNIEEGQISDTVYYLKQIIHDNEVDNEGKRLVLVSGVPGSGKTLAALKLLYDYNEYKLEKYDDSLSAIYLSGNGPLVSVLQSILSDKTGKLGKTGKTYVKAVRSYKQEYMNNSKVPLENVVIFDEAQRAWDKNKMGGNNSEADVLLKIGDKIFYDKDNVTIICFVGEGQSIYLGEEMGTDLWSQAVKKAGNWEIYCPPKYKNLFSKVRDLTLNKKLNLDHSIRNHFININLWIESILEGDFKTAKKSLKDMQKKGFVLRITRDFEKAEAFVKEKEDKDKSITYGLLVSSKIKDKQINNHLNHKYEGSYMKDDEVGRWFRGESKQFNKAASEFACQGLELDYPIVYFGGDYYYNGDKWKIANKIWKQKSNKYQDFRQIIQNIYRVLLSRGREGMVLYVPRIKVLNQTYNAFVSSGVREL